MPLGLDKRDGSNFEIWEKGINQTLQKVFHIEKFTLAESNFTSRLVDKQNSISRLPRSTVHLDILAVIDSTDEEDPYSIFALLEQKYSSSVRRRKLSLAKQMIALVGNKGPGSEATFAESIRVTAELKQLKVTVDELVGLLLQTSFVAPIGVDPQTFASSVEQSLKGKEAPSFNDYMPGHPPPLPPHLSPHRHLHPETLSTADEALDALAFIPMLASHRQYLDELVRRIIQLDHFDGTPMAHSARDQWLQDGVAPAAVQPDVLEAKPSTRVAVSSPSSTSSSSKASSTRVTAAAAPATRAHTTSAAAAGATLGEKKECEDIHSKISFSGGPSCLPSSIVEARKRSKQMPYLAPTDSANPGGLNNNSNSNSAAAAPGGAGLGGGGGGIQVSNAMQCLNCETTVNIPSSSFFLCG
ncbi:hypothetical protein PTTG_12207 [Puccinia triticina 1-1 BBBD Race 1]|uniref:Uncharacterized protein n=1 Tax=Puccinia triticina (isolate 1-1 / race 1 (BBBD)) TaxID=630390 RepID=A0A180G4R4_PUCT1|nr:hypothetical protein PTTG_12207 [Puccinia triticina 1-1 BBBD Race 1]